MPKILLVADDSHIREDLLRLHIMNQPLEIIPIESAPKVPNDPWLCHTIPIIASEPIPYEEIYPLPKKGIGQKAQWASKPHKRKRK